MKSISQECIKAQAEYRALMSATAATDEDQFACCSAPDRPAAPLIKKFVVAVDAKKSSEAIYLLMSRVEGATPDELLALRKDSGKEYDVRIKAVHKVAKAMKTCNGLPVVFENNRYFIR